MSIYFLYYIISKNVDIVMMKVFSQPETYLKLKIRLKYMHKKSVKNKTNCPYNSVTGRVIKQK